MATWHRVRRPRSGSATASGERWTTQLRQAHDDGVLTLERVRRALRAVLGGPHPQRTGRAHARLPDPGPLPRPSPTPPPVPVPARALSRRPQGTRRAVVGAALLGVALFGAGQVDHRPGRHRGLRPPGGAGWRPARTRRRGGRGCSATSRSWCPTTRGSTTGGTLLFGSTDCDAACDGSGTRDGHRGRLRGASAAWTWSGRRERQPRTATTTEARRRRRPPRPVRAGRRGSGAGGRRRRAPAARRRRRPGRAGPPPPSTAAAPRAIASTTWNGNASCVTHSSTASQRFASSRSTSHSVEPAWCG